MKADASHPEQVRAVLAGILAEPEIARNTYPCLRVGRIVGAAMGLGEGEHEAHARAWAPGREARAEYGSQVPADGDGVEV